MNKKGNNGNVLTVDTVKIKMVVLLYSKWAQFTT